MLLKAFAPAFCWLLIIVYLSTQGTIPTPQFNLFQMDKFAHAAAYGLLSVLILWGLVRTHRDRRFPVLAGILTFLFASGFGALMEVVQYKYFPGRFFEYDDMLANAIGAVLGWLIFAWALEKPFFQRVRNF
ncbi:MAG: VanZ family protein [Bacteroidetes bacterium]|nr:MAG: VanZ family protein [Bacteroidota bacterium]